MKHIWEILPGQLFQGDLVGAMEFAADIVVSCSPLSEVPALLGDLVHSRPLHVLFPFVDGPALPNMSMAVSVAELGARQIAKGFRLLVNCNMGENRSGLMCGLIMRAMGLTDVVDKIHKAHPEALNNKVFADYLDGLDE